MSLARDRRDHSCAQPHAPEALLAVAEGLVDEVDVRHDRRRGFGSTTFVGSGFGPWL